MMQAFWYANDRRRERFVELCADRDVQRLTWQADMYKRLVRASPLAHLRTFSRTPRTCSALRGCRNRPRPGNKSLKRWCMLEVRQAVEIQGPVDRSAPAAVACAEGAGHAA